MTKEEKKYINKINGKIGKTSIKYDLINDQDHLLVGLSGGKDSLALLYSLVIRRRRLPIDYKISALHVEISNIPHHADKEWLQQFCDELNVPLYFKTFELEMKKNTMEAPCYYCSINRRKQLFETARELGCNKIALGHHKNDIVETLLMNMIFHGKLQAMPVDLSIFNGDLQIIRPLAELTEEEIIEYTKILKFKIEKQRCEYGESTKRVRMKQLIAELQGIYPFALTNIFNSVANVNEEYLPIPKIIK